MTVPAPWPMMGFLGSTRSRRTAVFFAPVRVGFLGFFGLVALPILLQCARAGRRVQPESTNCRAASGSERVWRSSSGAANAAKIRVIRMYDEVPNLGRMKENPPREET